MKPTFFSSCLVLDPTSDDFSIACSRFLPCEAHFFLVFPRSGSDFGRFFDGSPTFFPVLPSISFTILPILNPISGDFSRARHSFQRRTSIFPCFSLYFPTLRALLRDISPFIFPTLPFLHSMNAFPIRASLILHALPHPYLPIYPLRPSFPLPLRPLPQFPSHSSPLTHERAHPLAIRAYAYTHTSGGFRLLPSPLHPPFAIHWAPMC